MSDENYGEAPRSYRQRLSPDDETRASTRHHHTQQQEHESSPTKSGGSSFWSKVGKVALGVGLAAVAVIGFPYGTALVGAGIAAYMTYDTYYAPKSSKNSTNRQSRPARPPSAGQQQTRQTEQTQQKSWNPFSAVSRANREQKKQEQKLYVADTKHKALSDKMERRYIEALNKEIKKSLKASSQSENDANSRPIQSSKVARPRSHSI